MNNIQSKFITILPGETTLTHHHHEVELWYILSGEGLATKALKEFSVKQGDIIHFVPLESHSIKNISTEFKLYFISIWWTDWELLAQANVTNPVNRACKNKNTAHFILPSFPTPNGSLHLGHLAGPYIAADIYKRYQQMIGKEAYYLLGTIGHQTQVACKSKKLALSFYETAEHYSADILKTLHSANIHPDIFVTPGSAKNYTELAQDFFTKLLQAGHLIFKTEKTHYCKTCDQYLFESKVTGTCPHCLSSHASGNECEVCAILHSDEELLAPYCSHCSQPADSKLLERVFFPLEPFRESLRSYYQNLKLSPRLAEFIEKVFENPLIEFPVSHLAEQGITVPLNQFQDQSLYSLFELPARYACAVNTLGNQAKWDSRWLKLCKNNQTKLFFGFDNAYLRVIIFPALLMAYDKKICLPDQLLSNEFYQLEGSKFSTSRNHAIWGLELLNNHSSDLLRFYLSYTRPETQQTSFSLIEFQNFIEKEVRLNLEGWLRRLALRLQEAHSNRAPEAKCWEDKAHSFFKELKQMHEKINDAYIDSAFSLQKITFLLLSLIRRINCFNQQMSTISTSREEASTHIALELMAARSLALLSFPLMPGFASHLWEALGYDLKLAFTDPRNNIAWLPPGQKINNLSRPYFTHSSD